MVTRRNFDLSIYFIADPSVCGGRHVAEVVHAAAKGGVTMVQYRDKRAVKTGNAGPGPGSSPSEKNENISSRDLILRNVQALKRVLVEIVQAQGAGRIPLIINDYVDIALEAGADGVHLGQEDMSPEQARALLGPEAIIGLTAYTEEHIRSINPDIVDYIGLGPFYVTKTEKGKPILGPKGGRNEVGQAPEQSRFAALAALSPVPVVGIGGITPENAAAVLRAGADGVAMMRSISEAPDPEKAARAFMHANTGR